MKKIVKGKHIYKGYEYKGYEVHCHGYYPPDKCVWWEAIDIKTGGGDVHAKTKKEIKNLIDQQTLKHIGSV